MLSDLPRMIIGYLDFTICSPKEKKKSLGEVTVTLRDLCEKYRGLRVLCYGVLIEGVPECLT